MSDNRIKEISKHPTSKSCYGAAKEESKWEDAEQGGAGIRRRATMSKTWKRDGRWDILIKTVYRNDGGDAMEYGTGICEP